jgi:hypothetical protein
MKGWKDIQAVRFEFEFTSYMHTLVYISINYVLLLYALIKESVGRDIVDLCFFLLSLERIWFRICRKYSRFAVRNTKDSDSLM